MREYTVTAIGPNTTCKTRTLLKVHGWLREGYSLGRSCVWTNEVPGLSGMSEDTEGRIGTDEVRAYDMDLMWKGERVMGFRWRDVPCGRMSSADLSDTDLLLVYISCRDLCGPVEYLDRLGELVDVLDRCPRVPVRFVFTEADCVSESERRNLIYRFGFTWKYGPEGMRHTCLGHDDDCEYLVTDLLSDIVGGFRGSRGSTPALDDLARRIARGD